MEEKTYKTYRQQLAKLRSRGMEIKEGAQGARAMRILEQENYYNVINYYLFNMLMVFIYYIVFASVYNFRWIFLNIFVINSIFILISYIKNSKDIKLFR